MTPEEKNEIYEKAFKHISNPSGDFEVFDKLKSVLDDKISYQIDQIKDYNKPILVIGGYRTLTLGVVSYLWYACTKNQPYNFILPLKHVEFAGLSEDEVKIRLFRNTPSDKINFLDINIDADLVHIVLFNGLLFIEKLNSEYTDIFERLAVIKRNHKGNGVLVVSTDKKDSLPKDLSQFEIIFLEPETKDIPASTPEVENEQEGLLDNAGCLHVGKGKIKLSPSEADLIRYMAKELKKCDSLDISDILYYHYSVDTRNKMTLSKDERKPFDNEAYKINRKCNDTLKKELILSLGNKKYTLSIKVVLPKNH